MLGKSRVKLSFNFYPTLSLAITLNLAILLNYNWSFTEYHLYTMIELQFTESITIMVSMAKARPPPDFLENKREMCWIGQCMSPIVSEINLENM